MVWGTHDLLGNSVGKAMSTGPDGPQAELIGANYLPNAMLGSLLCITGPIDFIDPVSRYKKARKPIVVLGTPKFLLWQPFWGLLADSSQPGPS